MKLQNTYWTKFEGSENYYRIYDNNLKEAPSNDDGTVCTDKAIVIEFICNDLLKNINEKFGSSFNYHCSQIHKH